jgi:hypothetical protein
VKRKRIILAAAGGVLLLAAFALFALFGLRSDGDVSKVSIDFAGYCVVDGEHSLILIVTNGSSYHISQPYRYSQLRGESPDSTTFSYTTACGPGLNPNPKWGWWQLKPPKIMSVAPGSIFRFTVPVDERPYTWHVTVPFTTIPFKDRLPFALRSRWPSFKGSKPISFEVSPPPIPPAPSQVLSAASVSSAVSP